MRPLQMVDTKNQYLKIKQEVDEAVINVLESAMFIGGQKVNDFGNNLAAYNGSKHVIPCANGTDALQIAMMALDLQPGDEIITPSFTYIATVEAAALLHLKPVFVEVDKQTFCIDAELIEKAITPKTKAIVPVHLYGHAAEMEKIMAIAKKHQLHVIEDNAQAIGSNYKFSNGTVKKTGSIGHIGCTSFYPSKNLGALPKSPGDFQQNFQLISNFGSPETAHCRQKPRNGRILATNTRQMQRPDWLAGDPVLIEPVSVPKSLLTGNIAGNFHCFSEDGVDSARKCLDAKGFATSIP